MAVAVRARRGVLGARARRPAYPAGGAVALLRAACAARDAGGAPRASRHARAGAGLAHPAPGERDRSMRGARSALGAGNGRASRRRHALVCRTRAASPAARRRGAAHRAQARGPCRQRGAAPRARDTVLMEQAHGKRPATSQVGRAVPRSHARRLAAGRGRYADDLRFPRVLHAAFLRSPHAHARIRRLDLAAARAGEGVCAVFDAAALAAVCKPWQTKLATWPGHRSPPQPPLAAGRALWQGQPVAIVLATTRALAEDAAERIDAEWEPLAALSTPDSALATHAPLLHPELGSNLAFEHAVERGDYAAASRAGRTVSRSIGFSRHTGVPLEPRCIVAEV